MVFASVHIHAHNTILILIYQLVLLEVLVEMLLDQMAHLVVLLEVEALLHLAKVVEKVKLL